MQAKPKRKISFDGYLSKLSDKDRKALEQIRKVIHTIAPGSTEVISYNIPVFKYNGNYLVGMGANKNFCSFYAMSGSLLAKFKDDLANYEQTKSALHFTRDKPIPAALIKKLVKERIKENQAKKLRKK